MGATRTTTNLSDALRRAILYGDYPFGSRLKIDEIARRYGVSHMPVRKALVQLQSERLVTAEPNRGASVRRIDVEFVGNTYDVVIPLEALLTRRAAARMTPAVLCRLTRIEEQLEAAAAAQENDEAVRLNACFHALINTRGANPEAEAIVNRSQELLRAFRGAYGYDPARLPGVIADHRSLLRAFADRDVEGAAAVAAGHAAKARSDLIATIRTKAPPCDDLGAGRARRRAQQ